MLVVAYTATASISCSGKRLQCVHILSCSSSVPGSNDNANTATTYALRAM